jgi:hypothetical protein
MGKIQLPDFQRGWVWEDERIRALMASVSRSFPIGALMTLETGGETKFHPRPVEGVSLLNGVEPDLLVLDGQQRLTSLFQATTYGKVVATKNIRRASRHPPIPLLRRPPCAVGPDEKMLSLARKAGFSEKPAVRGVIRLEKILALPSMAA